MYTLMYNYKGSWIHTEEVNYIPPLFQGMTVDFDDVHYEVSMMIIQPKNKRYKVFLERV